MVEGVPSGAGLAGPVTSVPLPDNPSDAIVQSHVMTESAFAETAKPQIGTTKKKARAKALIELPFAITQPRYSLFDFKLLSSFPLKIFPTPSAASSPPGAGFHLHPAHYSLCR